MNKERAKDELFHPAIRDVRRPFHCLNPEHKDENPSMGFDEKHQRVHCFSCGASYDIIDLIKLDNNFATYAEAFRRGYELYGIDIDRSFMAGQRFSFTRLNDRLGSVGKSGGELESYFEQCRARIGDTDYPQRRGLSEETVKRFGLGFDPSFNHGAWKAMIIPTGAFSYVARNVDFEADKDKRIRKFGRSVIYNVEALKEGQRNVMIGVRNNEVVYVPFSECIRTDKRFDKKLIKVLDELSI